MTTAVILQPMFFPWVGYFEQIRLADVFVFFDDVQMPRGRSLVKRVQVKTRQGSSWLTVPVRKGGDIAINRVQLDEEGDWRRRHRELLRHAYGQAPYFKEMMRIADEVYGWDTDSLCDMNCRAIESISRSFGLETRFVRSSSFDVEGRQSHKLLGLLQQLEATTYITGHGARTYLDHELFERQGIEVAYMDYQRQAYAQLHGGFDPHVSVLDLIANRGWDGVDVIKSGTVSWREFIDRNGVE